MKTGIKDFCKAVLKKVKNDRDIKDNPSKYIMDDCRDRVSFGICIIESAPGYRMLGFTGGYHPELYLDQEDIDYLYDKYSKQLAEELESNIEELKQQYK